jgi:hypothetical protein
MIPLTAIPWRLVGAVALVSVVALAGWRVTAWRAAYRALPAVEEQVKTLTAELAAERACEAASTCAERAETLALQAAQEAAERGAAAVQGAQAREEAAQREAAEWRRRFRDARQADPDCDAWAAAPVGCPL